MMAEEEQEEEEAIVPVPEWLYAGMSVEVMGEEEGWVVCLLPLSGLPSSDFVVTRSCPPPFA